MTTHAKFAASKMPRIIPCPGSVVLESQFPDSRNSYADEGTVAHHIAAICLKAPCDAKRFVGRFFFVTKYGETLECEQSKEGLAVARTDLGLEYALVSAEKCFTIDEEFAEYVQVYLDTVRRRAHGGTLLVEQRVGFSKAVGVEDQYGTSDAIIFFPKRLVCGDLKFGQGHKVFASRVETINGEQVRKGNEQCLTYLVAALEEFEDVIKVDEIEEFEVFISQPRIDHEDSWIFSREDIEKHKSNMARAVLEATVCQRDYERGKPLNEAFFKAGDEQCKFCKAKATCPTLAAHVSDAVYGDMKVLTDADRTSNAEPLKPTVSLLAARYAQIPLIMSWASAIGDEINRMVSGGMIVIGADGQAMKIVAGAEGNRAWKDEKKAEALLAGHVPADKLYKPRKLMSPSDAGKFFGERRKNPEPTWELVKPLFARAPGKPQLALGSDPRAPYAVTAGEEEMVDLSGDPTE